MSQLEKIISDLEKKLGEERRVRRQLESALDTLEEGFVFYDENDRLLFCNSRLKELFELSADSMTTGISFENLLRAGVERGEYTEALGREDEFIRERVARHRKADCTFDQKLTTGRWIRSSERRTAAGGTSCLRLDISELKGHEHNLAGHNHYLAALHEMSEALANHSDWDNVLDSIVRRACTLANTEHGFLYLYDEEMDELEMAVAQGVFTKSLGFRIRNGHGLAGKAMARQRPMVVDDYASWDQAVQYELSMGLHACVAIPLPNGRGALGLGCFGDNKVIFGNNEIDILSTFGSIASIAIENSILYSELKRELAQRELTEKAIQASNDYHCSLFDESPVAMSIQDFSQVKKRVLELESAGVKDIGSYLRQNQRELVQMAGSINLLRVNQSAVEVYRAQSSRELVGPMDRVISTDNLNHIIKQIDVFMSGATRYDGEALNKTLEGDILNVIIRKTVIPGYEHDLSRVLVSTIDLTQLYKAIDIKEKLENQLQQAQKMEAIGTLAGGIAHDFNNILAMIMGFGDLAREKAAQGINNEEDINQIVGAAERARNLVRKILTYSRRSETEMKPLDLNQAVLNSVKLLGRTVPKMIEIELNLAQGLDCILADATQMEQVIVNLANNAADAMPDGGRLILETSSLTLDRHFTEHFSGMSPGKYLLLMVTDTGCGMNKETSAKVFDPFFTTKEIGKGTGLGLSTVYGIVQDHGGHITCYSEPGLGTTFKIYLPAQAQSQTNEITDSSFRQEDLRGTETILMVDDEESIRKLVTDFLEPMGYRVICAATGEEAINLYTETPDRVDLVILDLGMPGMGGNKCLKELLNINPTLKIVIASGYSANGKVGDTLKEGAAEYLAKPFRLNNLLTKIRKVLDC